MKLHKILIGVAFSSLILQGTASYAATPFDNAQKKQIEAIVQDYLLKNPEVLVKSLDNYQQKQINQAQETFKKIQETSPQYANRLFHQSTDPIAGNPNGTITVVQFADYQCPHCMEMAPVIDNLIKKNKNVRVIFKEFPIRGPISEFATKAALASQKQGKYYEFHNALMNSKVEPLTEAAIFNLAKSTGLNVDQLKKDINDQAIAQQITTNYQLAKDMGLMWTPVIFIAKSNVSPSSKATEIVFIPGQVTEAQISDVINKLN